MMKSAGKPKAFREKARKERDEDLLLFREMFKREKERNNVVSLLEPVSSEFESSQGSFPLYKLPSGKKGVGNDFIGVEKEKNDYDWLKTPPATPLFQSLEMELNDSNMIFQKELPILQHIKPSRFAAKIVATKLEQRPKSPSSRSTTSTKSDSSSRSKTPSSRPTSSSGNTTTLKGMIMNPKERSNQSALTANKRPTTRLTNNASVATTKENSRNTSTPRKPQSRGVSPMTRPRIPATLPGFSDETPPNLITLATVIQGRATSATRGRPGSTTTLQSTMVEQNVESMKMRRQSCSPSVTRGRKLEAPKANNSSGTGTVIVGSRMVEKMMNARRAASARAEAAGEEEKGQSQANERPGVGRLMSRTSLNVAIKQWEISKDPVGLRSNTNATSTGASTKLSSQTTTSRGSEVRNFRVRTGSESKFPVKKGESRTRN